MGAEGPQNGLERLVGQPDRIVEAFQLSRVSCEIQTNTYVVQVTVEHESCEESAGICACDGRVLEDVHCQDERS